MADTTRGKGPLKVMYAGADGDVVAHIPDDVSKVVFVSNLDGNDTIVPVSIDFPDNVIRTLVARALANTVITHVRNGMDADGSNLSDLINEKAAQLQEGHAYVRNRSGDGAAKDKVAKTINYDYWLPVFNIYAHKKAEAEGKANDMQVINMRIEKTVQYFDAMQPKKARSVLSQWTNGFPDFGAAVAKHEEALAKQRVTQAPKMSAEEEMAAMFAVQPKSKKA